MMPLIPWILLALLLVEHMIFLPNVLKRAGLTSWHGFIPGLNYVAWLQVIHRPWYWIFLLIVPGINLLMLIIMQVELGICFGKRSSLEQWLHGALPWLALPLLSRGKEAYVGARDWTVKKKSVGREWGESILWALIVASVVRTFLFEAFTIPTASMEGSMLVGDYLYVSKTAYGPKVPQTPVSVPLIHNVLPGSMIPSYTNWFSLPFTRLPGVRDVERYDAVVFNFPHGDTIVVDAELAGHDYYGILRREAIAHAGGDIQAYLQNTPFHEEEARKNLESRFGIVGRPLDKTENYVKRCVALPGETIEVRNGVLMTDGVAIPPPSELQFEYRVQFKSQSDARRAFKGLGLTKVDLGPAQMLGDGVQVIIALTDAEKAQLEVSDMTTSMERIDTSSRRGSLEIFPNTSSPEFDQWDPDNLGPITLPSQGMKIDLNPRNVALYRRAISVYEGHEFEWNDDQAFIDGMPATEYTFELNYYWMMGDNRHRSADSRMWGFVPETHVVGRASFIWFSKQNEAQHGESKIRWNRMFKSVK